MRLLLTGATGYVGRRLIPVPLLSPRLSSTWLVLITAVPYGIARLLVEGLKYWWLFKPAHALIFPRLARKIIARARAAGPLNPK